MITSFKVQQRYSRCSSNSILQWLNMKSSKSSKLDRYDRL